MKMNVLNLKPNSVFVRMKGKFLKNTYANNRNNYTRIFL